LNEIVGICKTATHGQITAFAPPRALHSNNELLTKELRREARIPMMQSTDFRQRNHSSLSLNVAPHRRVFAE
jgi:hypothetical protein